MTYDYQIYINGLKSIKPYLQSLILITNYEGLGETAAKKIGEMIDAAIEALNKQDPKKPIDNHHCPSCETGLPHKGITDEWCKCCFDPDYCPHCGQAIDWSDDE